MIELTNIVKRYQQHEVLRGVSLRVADGEVCVLLVAFYDVGQFDHPRRS